jgi:hypothetical protein
MQHFSCLFRSLFIYSVIIVCLSVCLSVLHSSSLKSSFCSEEGPVLRLVIGFRSREKHFLFKKICSLSGTVNRAELIVIIISVRCSFLVSKNLIYTIHILKSIKIRMTVILIRLSKLSECCAHNKILIFRKCIATKLSTLDQD